MGTTAKLVGSGGMGQHVSRLLATLAPLLVLCVANVAAQPRPVVMGGDSGYRPFHYLDERGRARGFDVGMLREIMRTEGIPVRFEFGDWGDALARLERGEVAVVPMFISRDRQERYLFSKPFILRYHVVYGRAGTPPVRSLDGLAGRTVAVQSASLASDVLHAMPGVAPGLLGVRFEPDALEAVAQGRAQYALVPTGIGHEAMKHQEISGMVALSPPLLEREYAFAVSRSRPELVPLIDAGLDRMRTSGRQDQLFRDSLEGAGGTTDWLRWTVLAVLLGATAIAVSVVLAAGRRARARDTRVDGMSATDAARLASELRAAMAGGELGYALQPKLDLRTRRWAGAEVLVRWQHPQHGQLMPGAFLPIAARAGLGGEMTLYLTRRAAADFLVSEGVDYRRLRIMQEYIDALPSGSYVALSHFFDPETGLGLPSNPFYTGDPAAPAAKVWALGLRNPWRFTIDVPTGTCSPGFTSCLSRTPSSKASNSMVALSVSTSARLSSALILSFESQRAAAPSPHK